MSIYEYLQGMAYKLRSLFNSLEDIDTAPNATTS